MVCRLLSPVASLVAQAPGAQASVAVARGRGSGNAWLSCPGACGIFLDQEPNLYPLHWQVDSQPLDHQGSPLLHFQKVDFLIINFLKSFLSAF